MTGIFNLGPTMFPLFQRYMTEDVQWHVHDLRSGYLLDALTLVIENNCQDKGGDDMITAEAVKCPEESRSRRRVQLLREGVSINQRRRKTPIGRLCHPRWFLVREMMLGFRNDEVIDLEQCQERPSTAADYYYQVDQFY